MTRTLPKTILVTVAAVAVGSLGWVAGYEIATLYIAWPVLYQRENPAIFPAMVVIFTLGTVAVALATMMIVERLTRLAGTSRKRWRRAVPLVYLLAAAVGAAVMLYQHYQYLDQYRR